MRPVGHNPNSGERCRDTAEAQDFAGEMCGVVAVSAASKSPWRTSGSMSAPFGHTIVPSSSSTRTWRNRSGSARRGSNIGPQSSPPRSTSRSVPSSNESRRTKPSNGSTERMRGVRVLMATAEWYRVVPVRGLSPSSSRALRDAVAPTLGRVSTPASEARRTTVRVTRSRSAPHAHNRQLPATSRSKQQHAPGKNRTWARGLGNPVSLRMSPLSMRVRAAGAGT